MGSESKDVSESPLYSTSETRSKRWEYQKVISIGCQEDSTRLDSATQISVNSIALKEQNEGY